MPTSLVIVGSNPRLESAGAECSHSQALAARAGSRSMLIGPRVDLTYDYNLSRGRNRLAEGPGHSGRTCSARRPEKPLFLIGQGAISQRPMALPYSQLVADIAGQRIGGIKDGWNGFSILHSAASRVGGLDLGFVPGEGGLDASRHGGAGRDVDVLFNCSARTRSKSRPAPSWSIRASHGDRGRAPGGRDSAGQPLTLKNQRLYVNTEGRVQHDRPRDVFAPGDAQGRLGDHPRAVRCQLGSRSFPFDSLPRRELRRALYTAYPAFRGKIDQIAPSEGDVLASIARARCR